MPENDDIELTREHLHAFYLKYFAYYTSLSKDWKEIFLDRSIYMMHNKLFIGAEGFKPNNMVKAIISASAIQLTLGLKEWKLSYFETVIVYPKDFDDAVSGQKFKGETNLAGFIRLSWQSFLWGYKVKKDNINLGLHEFSHALRFNPIRGHEQDQFMEHYFDAWMASAFQAFNDIRTGKKTIFRQYGGTNINEFLSVCIEHFFESPEQIKVQYPLLYYNTAILLDQSTDNGITRVNIREELFKEKNELLMLKNNYDLNTKWTASTSIKILSVFVIPLIYTITITGFFSGESLFLSLFVILMYLRFDYYYIKTRFEGNTYCLKKGFLLFRHRKPLMIQLSQVVSLRIYGNGTGDSEAEIIYYNVKDSNFYIEKIPTAIDLSETFLNDIAVNKVAIFKL